MDVSNEAESSLLERLVQDFDQSATSSYQTKTFYSRSLWPSFGRKAGETANGALAKTTRPAAVPKADSKFRLLNEGKVQASCSCCSCSSNGRWSQLSRYKLGNRQELVIVAKAFSLFPVSEWMQLFSWTQYHPWHWRHRWRIHYYCW